MANPALSQKTNGKYLWFSLLAMGFQPEDAAAKTNVNVKHINLGPNMFDKPNKDAFYIVTHFLLEKLNPTRFHDAFRHCWPVLNHKADAEFRKVTCAWLREIMDEGTNSGPKVVASIFLSPGGPKFVSLMLYLTNHVMVQEMKTFIKDGSWVPEAAAMPASSLDMAVKRLNLVCARFLKAAVEQDQFLHGYQRKVQLLVNSMRDIRAEIAKYDELIKRHSSDFETEGISLPEKTRKVRSLWSAIDKMLSTTKEDRKAVESVLKGDADQFVLDGTDCDLKIPQCLLQRIEQLPHQLSSGNVYEVGQINLLSVLELTNFALQLLREERCKVSQVAKCQLSPQHLQEKRQQMVRVVQDLHFMRQKISKEEIPEVRTAVRELEAGWDRKWKDTLKDIPLVSFLNEDPALGFLSPMAPLSFEPTAETSYRSSVFSQYPAKLLDEKPTESKSQGETSPSFSKLKSSFSAAVERTENSLVTTQASRGNTSLDWLFETPSSPPQARTAPPPQANVRKMTPIQVAPMKTKTQILKMECDNLADQFADAVTTASPVEGRVKGVDLEGLLNTLQGDPFSTRKQLPRTPESLIMDVKSSWRKAIKEDQAEKLCHQLKLNSSITGCLTPLEESCEVLLSPNPSSKSSSCSITPPVSHKGDLLKSTLSWDNFSTEVPDSPSGTGSSVVHFSLDHETLPELPSCDSLLSLDETEDMKCEEELLIPSLRTEGKQSPLITCDRLGQLDFLDGFSMEDRNRTPEYLLSGHSVSVLGRRWPKAPATPVEPSDKVFSLDLGSLGTHSPPKKPDYSLPKLITFSPIDDMKR